MTSVPAIASTHLCLVSEQPLPNLVPALAQLMACRRVVLVSTPAMAQRSTWLARILADRNIDVVRHEAAHLRLPEFRAQIVQLLREHPDAALNVTGGLKTMALAAFDAARSADRPVFYMERDNRLVWLHPMDRTEQCLPGVLDLDTYFAAFGQRIHECHRQPDPLDAGGFPGWAMRTWSRPFNRRFHRALAHLRSHRFDAPHPEVARLARQWTGMGLVQPTPAGNWTLAPGVGPYLGGRWLESVVFARLRDQLVAEPGLVDIAWGVKISGDGVPNEIDVAIVRDNVLHIVECKSSLEGSVADFLYKLDSLRRKSGLTVRAALVTVASIADAGGHAERAREAGILLTNATETRKLADWLAGRVVPRQACRR